MIKTNTPMIIAHRGESFDAPENTLSAINLAWQRNADGIEIDVHLAKDNEIVVIHNNKIKNALGKANYIKTQTLEELRKIKIHNKPISTLSEVLLTVPQNKYIFIEIKCGIEITPYLKNVLYNSRLVNDQVKIIGFGFKKMSIIKNQLSQFEVLLNKRNIIPKINFYKPSLDNIINKLKLNSINGLNLAYSSSLNTNFVESFKRNNLKIFVWTVNDDKKASNLLKLGVDGVMTDRSGWIKERLTNN